MNWNRRADLRELMDDVSCSRGELREALRFLRSINRLTRAPGLLARGTRPGRVLDVATGGADIPAALRRRGLARAAIGVDRSRAILGLARELSPGVALVQADGRHLPFADKTFDTAVCHLFFHHLDEPDLVAVLREMDRVAHAVVVLDLSRSRPLYHLTRLVTRFGASRLARHDGPVSVQRSYRPREIEALAARAGVPARVRRRSLFRWSLETPSPRTSDKERRP